MNPLLAAARALLMATGVRADSVEEDQRALEGLLIAPCCWRQPVADHFSPKAEEIRENIRRLLAEGRTREEILEIHVAKYGAAILAQPPYEGFGLLAWVLPAVFLIGVAAWVARYLRRRRRTPATAPVGGTPGPADARYVEQLDRELREYS
jgi:cytochrome c-type biogenesis protein CcmH